MSINLEATIAGSTITIRAVISDFKSTPQNPFLYDPDSHSIQLFDPQGNFQGAPYTSPTRDSLGTFHQLIVVPFGGPAGNWRVDWQSLKGGNPTIGRIYFIVTV